MRLPATLLNTGRITTLAVFMASAPSSASAQHHPESPAHPDALSVADGTDYTVWDREGKRTSLADIVSAARSADVVLVGEEHDDMIGHAFQLALLRAIRDEVGAPAGAGRQVVFSMEMFERDIQYVLDEYLAGLISEAHFKASARPWPFYDERYRPLVEEARASGIPIVAANAPRRYVSRVSAEGPEALDALSEQARGFLPPLPYPGPSRVYREQWDALMSEAMAGGDEEETEDGGQESAAEEPGDEAEADESDDPDHGTYAMSPNIIQSQALWDAAMGHAVTQALVRHVGGLVLHIAGSFHVEKGTGIPERIADYRPGTRVISVVMTDVDDVHAWSREEHASLGDFVVLTQSPPEDDEGG